MQQEGAPRNNEKGSISPVEAYDILLQRQINEDRIVVERTTIFLAVSSLLFLAFAMLLNPTLAPIFKVLRIALPILGILLTALLYCANRAATNALGFWHGGQRKIEEETSEFQYMRENELTPHIYGDEAIWGRKEWKRIKEGRRLKPTGKWRSLLLNPWLRPTNYYITSILFPLFFALWVASLVVAIIS